MSAPSFNTWQAVHDEVRERVRARIWKPGELIPNESDLAAEFGCARTTVNRALRALAEAGLLDRRRKAGTRVAKHPIRKATLEIPIIRHDIEASGQQYGYALIETGSEIPPAAVRATMALASEAKALKIQALHLANGQPYVFEDRWINLAAVPKARAVDFNDISANEWLVANAPFSHGDIALSAVSDPKMAKRLQTDPNAAFFVVDRSTWDGETSITFARLVYAPGFQMRTTI